MVLTGPGGIGKTRLASAAAIAWQRSGSARRVLPCDLARGDFDALIAALTAQIPDLAPNARDPEAPLREALRRRGSQLLLIDSAEWLGTVGLQRLVGWLTRMPDLRALLTSRDRIETVATHTLAVERLPPEEAVELLLARTPATAVVPPDPTRDRALLREVAERLDGIPLALELAAARLEVLPLPALRDRLDRRFRLLRAPEDPADARHATLYRAIQWSWDDLAAWEQDAFAQLSVFEGGIPLDGAEAVVRLGGGLDAPGALDALHALVRRSLLRAVPAGGDTPPRFEKYDSIREFGAAQLDQREDAATVRGRHAEWLLAAADEWARGREIHAPGAAERLHQENANLLTVRRRGLQRGDAVGAAWAIAATNHASLTWRSLAPAAATAWGLAPLQQAEAVGAAASSAGAMLHRLVAGALRRAGRLEDAVAQQGRAVAEAHAAGDPGAEAEETGYLGSLLQLLGERTRADAHYRRALSLARESGRLRVEALALAALGQSAQRAGPEPTREAVEHLERAYERALAAGRHDLMSVFHSALGNLHADLGNLERARHHLLAGVELARAARRPAVEADIHIQLGATAHALEQPALADHHYQDAEACLGDGQHPGHRAFLELGRAALALERLDESARPLAEAARERVRAYRFNRQAILLACALATVAGQAALAGDVAAAEAAVEEADAIDASHDFLVDPVRALVGRFALVARARAALAADELDAARECCEAARAHHPAPADAMGRALHRSVERLLQQTEAGLSAWVVAADGSWFQAPEGPRVGLERRPTLQPLLAALAAQRVAHPGQGLALQELVAIGWPGERLLAKSARNRVYVAISTLRKMGLELLERSDEGGYLLAPGVSVRVAQLSQ